MTQPLGIALLGCGTVGGGVVRLLSDRADLLASRAGRPLELRRIVVRDPAKLRDVPLPAILVGTLDEVLTDPNVEVVVELVGGTGWARDAVLQSLAAGKHVVTANKALLAKFGPQVFEAARANGRAVSFEASVAGGVPIIAALSQSMAANRVASIQGILNGTSNFILTAMSEDGVSYGNALAEAQARGYAEADPTLDVDGSDAAHKLAILAQIAFGAHANANTIERRGISGLDAMDVRFAKELGYTIKLVAEAWLEDNRVALQVAPVLLRHTDLLAQVRGAYNAVRVVGDAASDTLYYGPGAGRMPTASAVVADLIDVATGRAQLTFRALRLWTPEAIGPEPRPATEVRSRFYVRLLVVDRAGVLADVARAFADEGISIASVIQHEALDDREGDVVPLVIVTHTAITGRFRTALAQIDARRLATEPAVCYSMAD